MQKTHHFLWWSSLAELTLHQHSTKSFAASVLGFWYMCTYSVQVSVQSKQNCKSWFLASSSWDEEPSSCVFRLDLNNHWAKSLAISGLGSQYMPADCIRVLSWSEQNCRSWLFA
jgi:hypothetical protein